MIYNFCTGAERTTTDATTVFFATADIVIRGISIAMRCTREDGGYFDLGIAVNDETVETHNVTVPYTNPEYSNKTYVYCGFAVNVRAGDKIQILRSRFSDFTSYYYDTVSAALDWGHTGSGAAVASISCSEMSMYIDVTNPWTIDSENGGYMRLVDNEAEVFAEFTKDRYGYPTNRGVWRFDGQNDGYPWITGYSPKAGGDRVVIMKNGVWQDTDGTVVFEDGAAVPAIMKITRGCAPLRGAMNEPQRTGG